jgi:hemoglobin/transferrin/lactoferrin receptor protein
MLRGVEVTYGPASTLYGSDALGGVIQMTSKSPLLSGGKKFVSSGSSLIRYSSANDEKTSHVDLNMGGKKWAFLQSYTYNFFDDLRMGAKYPREFKDFGKRKQYIANIGGIDTIVTNSNELRQRPSGFRQWSLLQKVLLTPSENVRHTLNLQHSNSTNVPRYDRLQDKRNNSLRYADWYYGPQSRSLAAYEFSVGKLNWVDELKAIASYQHIGESRHTRELRRYDRFDHRFERLHVLGTTIDVKKKFKSHEFTSGLDWQYNDVNSTANRENTVTKTVSKLDSRYPNGENKMTYAGVYAQHQGSFFHNKLLVNDGIRFQVITLYSTIDDNSYYNFPVTKIRQVNNAITGNFGLAYIPNKKTRATASLATAYRAPNIDDLAKIFESDGTARQLIIPNPGLKPEHTLSLDAGFRQHLATNVVAEVTTFYTAFQNAIIVSPFQLNGQDSVLYNGSMSRVFASQNKSEAFIYGFNANTTIQFTTRLKFYSSLSYTYGRIRDNGRSKTPLDHIPPVTGKTSLVYTFQRIHTELFVLYNGWKHLEDYSNSGEDNLQYATVKGMPGWTTYNFRVGFFTIYRFQIQAAIENIMDRNYRSFSSGFSAPGRNFIVAIRRSF